MAEIKTWSKAAVKCDEVILSIVNLLSFSQIKMTDKKIITDSVPVKGGADYTFICKRIPFAVSCTSTLPAGPYNYIDLDLVNKMRIPLLNIKVTRMCLHGHDVRAVGFIEQTVQCVSEGRVQGTVHLRAKVVRDLFNLLNVDCVASTSTHTRLTGHEPPWPPPRLPRCRGSRRCSWR